MHLPRSKEEIARMFSGMRFYEVRNFVFSFGQNLVWRRYLIREAEGRLLDVATGEGNVLRLYKRGLGVGVDISLGMLKRAGRGLLLLQGDAENLPLKSGVFDTVSVAFGFRNLPDKPLALREFNRVLRTGGKLLILDMNLGKDAFSLLQMPYPAVLMPVLAPLLLGGFRDYVYLFRSMLEFPSSESLKVMLREAGFEMERVYRFHIGSTYLYVARKVGRP